MNTGCHLENLPTAMANRDDSCFQNLFTAQVASAVEYVNCKELRLLPNECPGYDTYPSYREASVQVVRKYGVSFNSHHSRYKKITSYPWDGCVPESREADNRGRKLDRRT